METSKVRQICLFLSVTMLLGHWNLILFCFSLKQRTFNAFPLTLDERYEIQQLILGRKVYSIFAWWSSSNIRSLFLFLWFQVISFYSVCTNNNNHKYFSCWIRRYRGGIEERSGRWCGQDIYIRKQLAWMELYNRRSRKQAA